MLFKALLILMLSGTSSLYLLNFHGTRVDRKGLLLTFMCLEIFEKLFLDLVRCSTFTSLPRIDVCGWQNFWKLDTLARIIHSLENIEEHQQSNKYSLHFDAFH